MWLPNELYHFGTLGMHWGIRRYQNPDGSLTAAGRKRYGANSVEEISSAKGIQKRLNDLDHVQALNKMDYSESYKRSKALEKHKQKVASKYNFDRYKDNKKMLELNQKTIEEAANMRMAERNIKFSNKEKEALIKAAEIRNYNINSKEIQRLSEIGTKYRVKEGKKDALVKNTDAVYEKARRKEPLITKDVLLAVSKTSGNMHGLNHRLKTYESINRKIKTDSIEKNQTIVNTAKGIKDAVRYTTISSNKDFVENYNAVKKQLEDMGYTETKCKNYFQMYNEGKVKHKSVQSNFKTKDGYEFEIQFQTPASQKAKDRKLPLYEERRKLGISDKRAAELEQKMVDLAEKVSEPKNIYTIKSH